MESRGFLYLAYVERERKTQKRRKKIANLMSLKYTDCKKYLTDNMMFIK